MKKYRKLPIVIDAQQWNKKGDVPEAPIHPLDSDREWKCSRCGQVASKHGNCETLEGFHIVCPGDFIIKGVKGEFYPCKPEIFRMTYEKVEKARPEKVKGLDL